MRNVRQCLGCFHFAVYFFDASRLLYKPQDPLLMLHRCGTRFCRVLAQFCKKRKDIMHPPR